MIGDLLRSPSLSIPASIGGLLRSPSLVVPRHPRLDRGSPSVALPRSGASFGRPPSSPLVLLVIPDLIGDLPPSSSLVLPRPPSSSLVSPASIGGLPPSSSLVVPASIGDLLRSPSLVVPRPPRGSPSVALSFIQTRSGISPGRPPSSSPTRSGIFYPLHVILSLAKDL